MGISKNKKSASDEITTLNEPTMAYTYANSSVNIPSKLSQEYVEEFGYDYELTPEQYQLIDERVAEIENGTVKLIPHEEVMKKLRQRKYAAV